MKQEVFEKWINEIDWAYGAGLSSRLERRKETVLGKIKKAKTDEEILEICCGIFRCGYEKHFRDKLRKIKNGSNSQITSG